MSAYNEWYGVNIAENQQFVKTLVRNEHCVSVDKIKTNYLHMKGETYVRFIKRQA
jgi:hypothetical protein